MGTVVLVIVSLFESLLAPAGSMTAACTIADDLGGFKAAALVAEAAVAQLTEEVSMIEWEARRALLGT
jgi:ethanolamine transporter EutH